MPEKTEPRRRLTGWPLLKMPEPMGTDVESKLAMHLRLKEAVEAKRKTTKSDLAPYVLDHLYAMRVITAHPKVFYVECYPKQDSQVHDAALYARAAISPHAKRQEPGGGLRPPSPAIPGEKPAVSLRFAELSGKPPAETVETLSNKIKLVQALR